MSSIYLLIFFILIPYFFIELKIYGLKYIFLAIVLGNIFEMFFIGFDSILRLIALYSLNIAIIFLIMSVDGEINNRKRISSWSIFQGGVGLFTLFVTATYSFMFIVKYSDFGLNCDMLYDGMGSFLEFVSKPLSMPIEEVNNLKNKIEEFANSKVVDLIGIQDPENIDINSISKLKFLENIDLSGNVLMLSGQTIPLTGNGIAALSGYEDDFVEENKGLLGKVDDFKDMIIENVIKDKRSVDSEMCSYMIEHIKARYKNPTFKLSVVVLLFFLLWPFVRIIFFIVAFFNFILFKILSLLKIYRYQIVTDEVEEIV